MAQPPMANMFVDWMSHREAQTLLAHLVRGRKAAAGEALVQMFGVFPPNCDPCDSGFLTAIEEALAWRISPEIVDPDGVDTAPLCITDLVARDCRAA